MYYNNEWWRLVPKHTPTNIKDALDVSVLQNNIFEPILGIKDIRTDPLVCFVGGDTRRETYEKIVNKDKKKIVFYLYPTSVGELESIADARQNMPPKSTWFDPKLLTGRVFHELS